MAAEIRAAGARTIDYGWITSALLLLFLSLTPLLLPMADVAPEPAKSDDKPFVARKHNRVVLMIIDGLGYRKAVKSGLMPRLAARAQMSAFGMALASFPTITPTGLRAIISGHRMASEPQMPTGMRTTPELDSVLARGSAGGLTTWVVGQFAWPGLFPGLHGAHFRDIPYRGPNLKYEYGKKSMVVNYDEAVLKEAAPILAGTKGPWDFLVLHLFETDSIGHAVGTEDKLYAQHLPWLDQKLEELIRGAQEDQPTTFLLLADHGQAFDGAHGGLSDVERQVPFMLWGAGVQPGDLGTFPLYNAAPTLCALLGIPPPALNEGWPMLAGMQASERQKAAILSDLAQQRLLRWRTVKAALPGVTGQPEVGLAQVESYLRLKNYGAAAKRAEELVTDLDKSMQNALPEKWLWRLILALWVAILAASFGVTWRHAQSLTAATTGLLSLSCLVLLTFPLLRPSLWALASGLVLVGCTGIMLLTLLPVFSSRRESGLDWFGWGLWWSALAAIAFQNIIDIFLWSWLALAGLFIGRLRHLTKANAATTAMSLAAVLLCLAATSRSPSQEESLLRSQLPQVPWPTPAHHSWQAAAAVVLALLLAGSYFPFVAFDESPRKWPAYAFTVTPLVAAAAIIHWKPTAEPWTWAACVVSLAALMTFRPSVEIRGMWLSAICLAYYRTMADDKQWCLLALAVVVGWCLAWRSRDAHPLWEGLGLLGLGLWSFSLAGGRLSFSSITIAEGNRVLGGGWHPYALMALLTLKPLAAIGAPIMPRLSARSLYSTLGILPLLGSLSAGNLSRLWWDRFMRGQSLMFTDDWRFSQTIFVLILAWGVVGIWMTVRGMDVVSARLRRD